MEYLFNILIIVVALIVLYAVWGGVHLIAVKRLGFRRLGCRGPSFDENGNSICCNTGEICDKDSKDNSSDCASKTHI